MRRIAVVQAFAPAAEGTRRGLPWMPRTRAGRRRTGSSRVIGILARRNEFGRSPRPTHLPIRPCSLLVSTHASGRARFLSVYENKLRTLRHRSGGGEDASPLRVLM